MLTDLVALLIHRPSPRINRNHGGQSLKERGGLEQEKRDLANVFLELIRRDRLDDGMLCF
jgi:hypothetical protein